MIRLLLIGTTTLLLTACSTYQFSSNLDKENFDNYFKLSSVTIYNKADLLKLDYAFIATVEGSSCQENKNDRPADEKVARTNARIKAADLNANGIVFQSCLNFEADESCLSNIICYARAIDVGQ